MRKIIISFITAVALFTSVSNNSYGQCSIVLDTAIYNGLTYFNPDTINICLGESVYFHATGGCPSYLMANDFNDGTIGTGWNSNASPMFNNPCGVGVDGTTYLWIGPASNFPRELVTNGFQVTTQCQICFDMKYSVQADISPCEGPDLTTEGVHLQYSYNQTGPWTDINYWDPVGGYDPFFTTWQQYCENVPVAGTVYFRWYQTNTSGNDYDHWGLDNVQIFCPPVNQTVTITDNFGNTISTGQWGATVTPAVTTTYYITVSDGTLSATDSIVVTVYPPPTMQINGLAAQYCLSDPAVTISGTPTPGDLSGTGIVQPGTFNPATAGAGTHTITYHHYYVATNPSSGIFTLFTDNFATDLGWSGYGSGGWARGSATASGGCSGGQDPATDHTTTADNFIIGNYIGACYPNSLPATYWLTSPVINCSQVSNCALEFYSFSGCESSSYDHLYIEVFNGSWQNIYSNASSFAETAWTLRNYSVPQANNNPNFQVRFGMGTTDGSVTYQGWNIDDFTVKCSGTVMVTDTLCDFITTQNVVVNPNPVSTFTATGPICAGDPSYVTIGFPDNPAYQYNWTISPTSVPNSISGPGPHTLTWNSACIATITLTVTNTTTNCTSLVSTQNVQVFGAGTPNCCLTPTPDAGPNTSNICGLNFNMNALPPGPGNQAQWSLVSGSGTVFYDNSTLYNTGISVTQPGSYTFLWNEVSGGCDSSDQVILTFISEPVANIPTDNLQVCGNSTPLDAVISVTGSAHQWSVIAPQTATFTPNNTSQNVTATAGSGYGTYYFVWTEATSFTCYSTDTIEVQFLVTPTANAGIDTTACGNTAILTADPTFAGYWSTTASNCIFTPDIYSPSATVSIPPYVTPTQAVTFTWHASNGPCTSTDNVIITFMVPPHAEAGPTQSICGYEGTLHADTTGAGIIWATWMCGLPGLTIDQVGNVPANADIDATNVGNFFANNSQHQVYFYWVVQNGLDCKNRDSVLVTFYEIPDAYAGADDSVCGKTYDLVGQFDLDNPSGNWSVYTKPLVTSTASFLPPADPDGEVTVSDYGVYQFIWRESNAGNLTCLDRDTLQIYFMTVPHPDAGLDQDICGKYVELYANTTPGTDGYWQSILNAWYDPTNWPNDTVTCMPCSNDSSVVAYFSSENVTVTYYWMEFNGQCYGYDSVKIYFGSIQEANHLVDHADSTNCGRSTDLLVAEEPTYGDGYWYDSVPLTQFYPNNFNDNPDSTVISNSSYGMHYFYWVTQNGNCNDTSDVVPINFIRQPQALAGPITTDPNTNTYFPGIYGPNSYIKADTVCGLEYDLHAIPSYGNGTWFTLDPNNTWFDSTGVDGLGNAIPSPYPLDGANINFYTVFNAPYYREFIWIEDNLTCVDKDTIRIYFAPRPSGNFTATMPACRFDSSMIIAHTWPLPNNVDYGINYFGWDYGSGIIWDTSVNVFNQDTIYVSWPTGNSHSVTLITENLWECRSTINQHTVNEPPLFSPDYEINPATCDNSNGEVIISTGNNTYSFEWLDSTIVNPFDTAQSGLTPGYTYQVVVTGQSLSPDATPGTLCHDVVGITMTTAGQITAFFDTLFTQMLPVPQSLPLVNLTNNGRRFSWRIFDEDGNLVGTTSTENPTWNFEEPGCYRIVLVAESKVDTSWFGIERFGCKDTFEYKWLCFDATPILEVPNVFTPNSDGINDVFLVNAKSLTEFHAILFNRWGKKIYEWDDSTKGWDGKIGGADASPGVYYYIITATGKDDSKFDVKGFFYLMREK